MALVLNSASQEKNKDCRNVWKKASLNHAAHISHLSSDKAALVATLGKLNGCMRKGDRVLVNGSALEREGDRNYPVYSSHNGVYQGKRYFYCPRGHGAMVRCSDVKPLNHVPRKWPLTGNEMFPSYEGVKKRRKLRELIIKEAEEKFRKEHEANRRALTERFSKSQTQLYVSDKVSKDYLAGEKQKQAHINGGESFEELHLRQLKKAFGGDEKAERMAQTLRKLRRAFEEGRIITLGQKA